MKFSFKTYFVKRNPRKRFGLKAGVTLLVLWGLVRLLPAATVLVLTLNRRSACRVTPSSSLI